MQKHHKQHAGHVQIDVEALIDDGRYALRQHLGNGHSNAKDDDDFRVQCRQCGAECIVTDAPIVLALLLRAIVVAAIRGGGAVAAANAAGNVERCGRLDARPESVHAAATRVVDRTRRLQRFVAVGQLMQ